MHRKLHGTEGQWHSHVEDPADQKLTSHPSEHTLAFSNLYLYCTPISERTWSFWIIPYKLMSSWLFIESRIHLAKQESQGWRLTQGIHWRLTCCRCHVRVSRIHLLPAGSAALQGSYWSSHLLPSLYLLPWRWCGKVLPGDHGTLMWVPLSAS